MASIRRRGPHQFQARIRLKGYPHQERTFCTRKDAADWWRRITIELLGGRRQGPEPQLTLADALRRYQNEVTALKKSALQERGRIKHWLTHALATRQLASLAGVDFARWRDLRAAAGIAPNTIRLDLALISHLFEVARKDWGFTALANPVKDIRKPKLPRGRDRRLKPGEEERLIAHCREVGAETLASAITLAIHTAMRRSELVALRWDDIDFTQHLAHLRDTKNGESRSVPLSTAAIAALRALPRHPSGQALALHRDSITWGFHKASVACGISGLRFHDLRHEATSRLFERVQRDGGIGSDGTQEPSDAQALHASSRRRSCRSSW